MKQLAYAIIAIIAIITLCSFTRPDKIQRRKGVMTMNEKGKVVFTPLEDWKDYKPESDTCYQIKIH